MKKSNESKPIISMLDEREHKLRSELFNEELSVRHIKRIVKEFAREKIKYRIEE